MYEFLQEYFPLIGVFAVLVIAWFILRNKPTPLDSVTELDERIGNGKPVLLRFYRNT